MAVQRDGDGAQDLWSGQAGVVGAQIQIRAEHGVEPDDHEQHGETSADQSRGLHVPLREQEEHDGPDQHRRRRTDQEALNPVPLIA